MKRDQFWLTDEQFSRIAPHLPTDTRGKPRVDDRRVMSGIVHVLKSGGRWIDEPPDAADQLPAVRSTLISADKAGVWSPPKSKRERGQ
jgi:transposase